MIFSCGSLKVESVIEVEATNSNGGSNSAPSNTQQFQQQANKLLN